MIRAQNERIARPYFCKRTRSDTAFFSAFEWHHRLVVLKPIKLISKAIFS